MKRIIDIALALGLSAGLAAAETDYKALAKIQDIQKGVDNANQIQDLRVKSTATIGGNVSVGGTMSVTGNTTLSGSLDVDSVTVDAGAGIDNQAAGTLLVGASTATKVEIADTGVETEVQGDLEVQADIDTMAAGTLTLGSDAATKVEIADTGVETEVQGSLDVLGSSTTKALEVTGDLTVQAGLLKVVQVNDTTTNGAVITISAASTFILDASAQPLTTITNTIVAPGTAGIWAVLINDGASNGVEITEGTTLDSGGDKTLGPEDVMLLFAPSAATWSAIYHDN